MVDTCARWRARWRAGTDRNVPAANAQQSKEQRRLTTSIRGMSTNSHGMATRDLAESGAVGVLSRVRCRASGALRVGVRAPMEMYYRWKYITANTQQSKVLMEG